ncbi:hypothetical protein K438DRAFT_1940356 [Mycena galopus ATCC 62051]|nr:hypothetical protein K438DRAFT_1940356 [Mycena galopus ATCC 62051]
MTQFGSVKRRMFDSEEIYEGLPIEGGGSAKLLRKTYQNVVKDVMALSQRRCVKTKDDNNQKSRYKCRNKDEEHNPDVKAKEVIDVRLAREKEHAIKSKQSEVHSESRGNEGQRKSDAIQWCGALDGRLRPRPQSGSSDREKGRRGDRFQMRYDRAQECQRSTEVNGRGFQNTDMDHYTTARFKGMKEEGKGDD